MEVLLHKYWACLLVLDDSRVRIYIYIYILYPYYDNFS